jgi:hypothetical protein
MASQTNANSTTNAIDYITKQTKLSKDEWDSIEVPLAPAEMQILSLIQAGFHDVNITRNSTPTLLQHMKITVTPAIEAYIYTLHFQQPVADLLKKYGLPPQTVSAEQKETMKPLKKADLIRLENTQKHIEEQKQTLFEFILLELLEKCLSNKTIRTKPTKTTKQTKKQAQHDWLFYYYTLHKLLGYKIDTCNSHLRQQIVLILEALVVVDAELMKTMLSCGQHLIEKNMYLLKYADETLYDHQKQLFTICKQPNPKLVLYIAPTGTGKTMSPLGLAEKFKVIFVCAARHVGLALAKAAISMRKKIAFAFGCKDAEDIRLHYYAAKEYTINQKSGGIGKVDNSQGEKVEIVISDVQSYLPAMLYMLAFNPKEKIILYWDEPTITMDYAEHELHATIQRNWQNNLIPNVVLSSATLPQKHELSETITDFCTRFDNVDVHEIVSYDCKKTIPLINREGFVEMPHYLFAEYDKIEEVVKHCLEYKTLLRYLDLQEAIQFILLVEELEGEGVNIIQSDRYRLHNNFNELEHLNMYNIKMFYLHLLGNLQPNAWSLVYKTLQQKREKRFVSNVNIVTTDAHTLTDGPTIFLADDVNKIAQFYIQNANIPEYVTKDIMEKIQYNRQLNERVNVMQKKFEDETAVPEKSGEKDAGGKGSGKGGKGSSSSKGAQREDRISPEMKQLKQQIEELQVCMKMVVLNPIYVPNTHDHLYKYAPSKIDTHAFTCNVSEYMVEQIMQITDIADYWKLLLMMGIGVFAAHKSTRYVELMKQLAQEHKLYMIIASTDYIYGTNYQLCHGYIAKDLGNMSQEKCIQAMGRVGRNKLQQDYSVRFRDNELLYKLFQHQENKPEVINMGRLLGMGDNSPTPPLCV